MAGGDKCQDRDKYKIYYTWGRQYAAKTVHVGPITQARRTPRCFQENCEETLARSRFPVQIIYLSAATTKQYAKNEKWASSCFNRLQQANFEQAWILQS